MKKAPYMPLWIDHYLADTQALDTAEHGAYLLLIMAMWKAGGKLPAGDRALARLACATPEDWKRLRKVVLKFFIRDGAGSLTHKRVALEIERMRARSDKAQASVKTRWKSKKMNEDSGLSDANVMLQRYRPKELSQDNSLGGRVEESFEWASEGGQAWGEGRG
jgi:uncharacterized protein YdaU (DUF1376 family)